MKEIKPDSHNISMTKSEMNKLFNELESIFPNNDKTIEGLWFTDNFIKEKFPALWELYGIVYRDRSK